MNTNVLTLILEALESHKPKVLYISHGDLTSETLQLFCGIGALFHENNCILIERHCLRISWKLIS